MERFYTGPDERYQDQSELKESARGNNNAYSPLFNPGCWPEHAVVGACVYITCAYYSGNIIKYFHDIDGVDKWLSSLGPGEVVSGEIVYWPAEEKEFDVDNMIASLVRV